MLNTASKKFAFDLEEVWWDDVRDEVHRVNTELAHICDQINPNKKYPLVKIRYPYGAEIVDRGKFHLPTLNKELVAIDDAHVPHSLKQQLSYCPIPLSLILHNDNEVFVAAQHNRIIPLNYFKPGDLFGVFETMNPLMNSHLHPLWSVTAGGRSVFMIPRIADTVGHKRIKKEFGINDEPPADLASQWQIFKGIYHHAGGISQWDNSILVFTDNWFKTEDDDSSPWLKFNKYLFKVCWNQMQLLRDAIAFNLLWASFSDAISSRNLKPRPYLVDTLKHLVSIANGAGVAFKPITDEASLPGLLIQNAYVDFYNLKNYMPTLMQPCKLQGPDKKAYYSLAFPTVQESSPYKKNAPSIIEDEREIKRLMDTLIRTVNHGDAVINPIKHVKYEFFHTDIDHYGEIKNSKDIPVDDSRFNYAASKRFKDRTFCATSLFFRGCISLTTNGS